MRSRIGSANRTRRRRWWTAVGAAALVAVLVFLAAAVWFLFPPRATAGNADAVFVLAGATDGRHDLGAELIESDVADHLVVSNPSGPRDEAGYSLCAGANQPIGTETWCLDPEPTTTTGEAQTFDRLAENEGWDTAVVVTNRPHTRRVRVNLDECTEVETTVMSIDGVDWSRAPYHVAREIGGFLKYWITDPC